MRFYFIGFFLSNLWLWFVFLFPQCPFFSLSLLPSLAASLSLSFSPSLILSFSCSNNSSLQKKGPKKNKLVNEMNRDQKSPLCTT